MKILDRFIIMFFNLCLLITTIWAIIIPVTRSTSFYEYQFKKNNTAENTGWCVDVETENGEVPECYEYNDEQLNIIMKQVIDYLMGDADSMQVEFDGKLVFSNQALIHMRDVKDLYTGGRILGWIFFALTILTLAYIIFFFKRLKPLLFKYSSYLYIGIGIILLLVAIYAIVDFYGAFDLFHHIIFPNEQKYDDSSFGFVSNYPEEYYINNLTLTNILSIEVFMDAAIFIFVGLFVVIGGWLLYTFLLYKKEKKRKN